MQIQHHTKPFLATSGDLYGQLFVDLGIGYHQFSQKEEMDSMRS